jgi:hypothetical protein
VRKVGHAVFACFALGTGAEAKDANCLPYEQPIVLSGTVSLEHGYGPPSTATAELFRNVRHGVGWCY